MKKHKQFSPELWQKITSQLEQQLNGQGPFYAAFDADGTLWDCDLGESFFQYQIREKLVPLPPEPWQHYRKMKASGDPRPAYLWLAQICAGYPIEEVRAWASACVQKMNPLPIFADQQRLIEWLQKRNVKIFVVTASVKWAVEPGAQFLGIPENQVLGVHTKIENGLVTLESAGPITYQPGKVEALKLATQGVLPILVSGNSTGDLHLLQASQGVSLAVASVPPEHELYATEQKLQSIAHEHGWLQHHF